MSLIKRMRRQYAVYWPPGGFDRMGQPVPGTAVEIRCRWQGGAAEVIADDGTPFVAAVTVYPDRPLACGGYLWEGRLADAPDSPATDDNAFQIRRVDRVPNIKATETLHRAYA